MIAELRRASLVRFYVAPILLLGLMAPTLPVRAETVVYRDRAAFLAAIGPGYYAEDFTRFDPMLPFPGGEVDVAKGPFAYTISSPGNVFVAPGNGGSVFVATSLPESALLVTFASGNVRSFGGNFFCISFGGGVAAGNVVLNLSDGTTETFSNVSFDAFRGFVSDTPISSVTMEPQTGQDTRNSVDNLIVSASGIGSVAPEPVPFFLMGAAFPFIVGVARRRRIS